MMELYWSGADLVPKSQGLAGRELKVLCHELAEAYSRVLDAQGCEDLPKGIRDMLERVASPLLDDGGPARRRLQLATP